MTADASAPGGRQVLVTVPWLDAFKSFKHAPDYSEAIATCQAHERTALTYDEEDQVYAALERTARGEPAWPEVFPSAPPVAPLGAPSGSPPSAPKPRAGGLEFEGVTDAPDASVLNMDDFRRRKR